MSVRSRHSKQQVKVSMLQLLRAKKSTCAHVTKLMLLRCRVYELEVLRTSRRSQCERVLAFPAALHHLLSYYTSMLHCAGLALLLQAL
jgi:hypothetical protein